MGETSQGTFCQALQIKLRPGSQAVRRRTAVVMAALAALAAPQRSRAEHPPAPEEPLSVSWGLEAGLAAGAVAGSVLLGVLMPVDTGRQWRRELLPLDERVKRNFSSSADASSDVTLALTISLPFALQLGRGMDEEMGKSAFVYTETIAATVLLYTIAKYTVRRPRPYTYSQAPQVRAFVEAQRQRRSRESHLSFYSGHAALAFTSAVAGSYLFAQSSNSTGARATVWGVELALAAATANLRVRAGKHFYSDVIVGSLVGAALGFGLPYAHGGPRVSLSTAEWITIGCAPVFGVLASQLLPFGRDVNLPLFAEPSRFGGLNLYPWLSRSGAGLAAGGAL